MPFFKFFFNCSGFCHTLTWISHGSTCVPHPDPPSRLPLHPIPLGLPSAPAHVVHACMLSHFSRVRLFATPSTVACKAPLCIGFSRQEYWNGLSCTLPQGIFPPRDRTHIPHISCIGRQVLYHNRHNETEQDPGGSWAWNPFCVPHFLLVGTRFQSPGPSLSSKRQVQAGVNQVRERMQKQEGGNKKHHCSLGKGSGSHLKGYS